MKSARPIKVKKEEAAVSLKPATMPPTSISSSKDADQEYPDDYENEFADDYAGPISDWGFLVPTGGDNPNHNELPPTINKEKKTRKKMQKQQEIEKPKLLSLPPI